MTPDIQLLTVAGENALADLDKLLTQFPSSHLYPILLGDAEEKARIFQFAQEAPDPRETIEFSRTIDGEKWFHEQSKELELDPPEDGEWPKHPSRMGIVSHLNTLTHTPKSQVYIAMIKLAEPWEAFAYLKWGAWNDCPEPAIHCAIHRYWQSRHGSQVVSITGDIVQTKVTRPPTDRQSALQLAREQYIYCYDIVEQGVESIAALAASIMDWNHWYFWWD